MSSRGTLEDAGGGVPSPGGRRRHLLDAEQLILAAAERGDVPEFLRLAEEYGLEEARSLVREYATLERPGPAPKVR